MKVNVYIKKENGYFRMEQLEASSINEAAEVVAMYLDGEEIVFAEDNMNPQNHTF